jgi:hypothetical protein
MPPGQQPQDPKISNTLKAIKKCGWRTTNEFVEGFYGSSNEAAQSFCYQPGSSYGPERILTTWMSNFPSHLIPCHALLVRQLKYCEGFHRRQHMLSNGCTLRTLPCQVTDFQTRPSTRGRLGSWYETSLTPACANIVHNGVPLNPRAQ